MRRPDIPRLVLRYLNRLGRGVGLGIIEKFMRAGVDAADGGRGCASEPEGRAPVGIGGFGADDEGLEAG